MAEQAEGGPFDLALDTFGRFRQGHTCILWAGPSETPSELETLHRLLRRQAGETGLHVGEEAFRPHVTLVRKASPRTGLPKSPAQAVPVGAAAPRLACLGNAAFRFPLRGSRGEGPCRVIRSAEPLELQHGADMEEAPVDPARRETGILVASAKPPYGAVRRLVEDVVDARRHTGIAVDPVGHAYVRKAVAVVLGGVVAGVPVAEVVVAKQEFSNRLFRDSRSRHSGCSAPLPRSIGLRSQTGCWIL